MPERTAAICDFALAISASSLVTISLGMATVAKTPKITITKTNSISVNAFFIFTPYIYHLMTEQ